MKNWSGFYPETIKSQFIKDLVKMEDVGNIQWIFHKIGNTTDLKSLKENVIKALRKADGSPVEELEKISLNKIYMLFPESKGLIENENRIKYLLMKLEDDNVFNRIFKIEQ